MDQLVTYIPLFLSIGLLIFLFELFGTERTGVRVIASLLCTAMTLRYLQWRLTASLPDHQTLVQRSWTYLFLTIEVGTLVSSILIYFFMSRTLSRSGQADAHAYSLLNKAPVDVFIATYNEPRDVIERTMVGAMAIDHDDLRVWILDDGSRAWVKELADQLGVHYLSRYKGKHAKAGNINNGVKLALAGEGRKPEYFLILDADFVPSAQILNRVLGLFDDPSVGIVQTPQHFFNQDPLQDNLFTDAVWPDEQRFFFNSLMPCKDAWGAAFCCGTSAIFRTRAFVEAGGMPVDTVTEDMLTSFKFEEFGYKTIFLNERLSLGLAPESIVDFISQRSRWCLGAIQQIFTRWNFAGRGSHSFINRLAFFDTVLYWATGATFKIMLVSAPMIFWFTGTAVINATGPELVYWMAPVFFCNLVYMHYIAKNRVLPIMTDITQLLTAFVILQTVVTGLLRPFGRPFKVTAKGVSQQHATVHWSLLWPHATIAIFTFLGILLNLTEYSPLHGRQGYSTNIVWSLINSAMLFLAAFACVDPPRRRRDERFPVSEKALLRFDVGPSEPKKLVPANVTDISLGGIAIDLSEEISRFLNEGHHPEAVILNRKSTDALLEIPVSITNPRAKALALKFSDDDQHRHALILKLYTGDYHREVEAISPVAVFVNLLWTLLF